MLRRRGGSGTINPTTGLPEFANIFQKIGRAVKKFANSTVGRILLPIALGFFLGPAAAGLFGVTSTVGVAAISGFVGSAGATFLGGGNIGQALKAGAIGGLTAGAGAGIMGGSNAFASGSYTGPTTVGGQFDLFKNKVTNFLTPSAAATPPDLSAVKAAPVPNQMTVNPENYDYGPLDVGVKPTPSPSATTVNPENYDYGRLDVAPKPAPTMVDNLKDFYGKNIDPAGIQAQGVPGAEKAGTAARDALLARTPTATAAMQEAAYQKAYNAAMPGMLRTYAPITAVGLGTVAAFGGFDTKPVEPGNTTRSLMKPVTQRIAEDGTQRQMYLQNLPGVEYDAYGAPIYGRSTRLPTYDIPDYNSGGYRMSQGPGAISMPSIYIPQPGSIGSSGVAQPYNTADMYSNLVPRQYAEGGYAEGGAATGTTVSDLYRSILRREPSPGEIDWWNAQFAGTIGERERAVFRSAAAPELAGRATEQKTARDAAAQQRAMRRSQGSGQMYNNISAGLGALAPETNPMLATDTTFGARNRGAGLAGLQMAYGPMLQSQRDAMAKQKAILTNTGTTTGSAGAGAAMSAEQPFPMPRFTNAGKQPSDFSGFDDQTRFGMPGGSPPYSMGEGGRGLPPSDYQNPSPFSTNRGGIAALAQGGYPRRNGQINGPGTEKSDSIPAMLSDGEFVMTAKAVRGAGKGSRRAGAKKMYSLMHQLEKNSERG